MKDTLLIRNARIIDGSGAPSFAGDILIEQGRIAEIWQIDRAADRVMDVERVVVAPGFIDVHTHYDAQALWDPLLSPSSNHGITTALCGNCGFTLAPLSGRTEDVDYLLRMLSRVEGMSLDALKSAVVPRWRSFGEYLDQFEGRMAINTGFLVGHSALRVAVMGTRAVGHEASGQEIEAMCLLLRQSLEQGGLGFSTTTSPGHSDMEGQPVPSRWATREERLALCAVVRDFPGTWLEIVPGAIVFTEAHYALMTDMALAADRPLNWNVYIITSRQPEALASQLAATDYAAERGASVFGLVQAAPSKLRINLLTGQLLDGFEDWKGLFQLPHEEKLRVLADPEERRRLAAAPNLPDGGGPKLMFQDWGLLTIEEAFLPDNKRFEGRTLTDIASELGRDPFDALLDIALSDDLRTSFAPPPTGTDEASWAMRAAALRDEERCVLGGSDAGAHLDMSDAFTLPTRLLGDVVRERGLLGLEEAVRLITSAPAARFGLKDRGTLAVGKVADIVVFDPETIGVGPVHTRFDLPEGGMRLFADAIGIRQVIVGGQVVIEDGSPTGNRPGSIFRAGRDTYTVKASAAVAG